MSTVGSAVARQGQRKGDFLAGKYLLEDCLGIGGMGEVYRATNVSLGRKVAIKLLSPEFVHIEEDVLRFLREARAAAGVRHANVVDVLDVARTTTARRSSCRSCSRRGPRALPAGARRPALARKRRSRSSSRWSMRSPRRTHRTSSIATSSRRTSSSRAIGTRSRRRCSTSVRVCSRRWRSAPRRKSRMLIGTPHYMAPEQIVSKADVDAPLRRLGARRDPVRDARRRDALRGRDGERRAPAREDTRCPCPFANA